MSQQINLFNPVFLKQKKYFSVLAMLQALALIVAGSALFYAYAAHQVTLLAAQSNEATKRYDTEQLRLAALQSQFSPQQVAQLLGIELKQAQARAAAQQELLDTLKGGAIGNTTGYSQYLRAFARQSVNGLWLTGFDIAGDAAQLSMKGAVLSPDLLPVYVQQLGKEKVLHGKSFAVLQMQQPKVETGKPALRYVEFTLQSVEAGSSEAKTGGAAP
ncbi:MAG: fimbrial assembly protein [Nitrosomonadales bacterium]|nr:fimbrial assembly protein [Nitrosomonadales bacterium]